MKYIGYTADSDEWVTLDRLRSKALQKAQRKSPEPPPVAAAAGGPGPTEVTAARALADFVRRRGGSLEAGHVSEFYKQRPSLKAVVGNLHEFCDRHGSLVAFRQVPGKTGLVTLATPPAGAAERAALPARFKTVLCTHFAQGSCAATACAFAHGVEELRRSAEEQERSEWRRVSRRGSESSIRSAEEQERSEAEKRVATKLLSFVRSCGGSVSPDQIAQFYKQEAGEGGYKATIGQLWQFCERFSDSLVYHPPGVDGRQPVLVSLAKAPTGASPSKGPGARGERASPEDAVAAELASFVRSHNGRDRET